MVDNRGVTPISGSYFKSGDASGMANKMSEEKNGQGGEYFAQEVYEEETKQEQENYQDRSAILRASLKGLAMANAGSMMLIKTLKEKEEKNKKEKNNQNNQNDPEAEEKEPQEADVDK